MASFQYGATKAQIQRRAGLGISPKAMQRSLVQLAKEGKVKVTGQTSDRVYYLASVKAPQTPEVLPYIK